MPFGTVGWNASELPISNTKLWIPATIDLSGLALVVAYTFIEEKDLFTVPNVLKYTGSYVQPTTCCNWPHGSLAWSSCEQKGFPGRPTVALAGNLRLVIEYIKQFVRSLQDACQNTSAIFLRQDAHSEAWSKVLKIAELRLFLGGDLGRELLNACNIVSTPYLALGVLKGAKMTASLTQPLKGAGRGTPRLTICRKTQDSVDFF